MTLPVSPATITVKQLQTEYGGDNPVGMLEYYRGGAYVPVSISVTTGQAAGSYTSYQYNGSFYSSNYRLWKTQAIGSTLLPSRLYWENGQTGVTTFPTSTGHTVTQTTGGGYDYQRGSLVTTIPGSKGDPTTYRFYNIRRRTSATTSTVTTQVNTNVAASGTGYQIFMTHFYGGRKT